MRQIRTGIVGFGFIGPHHLDAMRRTGLVDVVPIAKAAARAGKHVIVDKPMAMNLAEAEDMLRVATEAGVIHAVTFSIRYNIMVQQAREMVQPEDVAGCVWSAVNLPHNALIEELVIRPTETDHQ